MEKYIVSARKYRPSTFDTLVGQQALAHTLKTAIRTGRLAHAYLFCGPRGVGKTSCARIFAKTINCTNPTENGEACGECESCRAFNEGRSFNIIELDAASNNAVDDIRELTDQVRIPPAVGKYRVYIIDEVHMLTTSAFNAFLKTLEEPPAHAIFILATTEKHKIIPTILSRCQIYDFTRILVPDIVEQLQHIAEAEGIKAEVPALNIIAQKADGAMRDALSIFDQVAASSEGNITYQSAIENLNVLDYEYYFRLVEAFLSCNVPECLLIYKDIRDHGFDSLFFVNGLAQHLRDLMVATNAATVKLLEKSDDVAQRYLQQSQKCEAKWLYKAMDLCNRCDLDYRIAANKQFLVELTLIKLCQLSDNSEPQGQTPQLKRIEPQAPSQVPVQQAQAAPAPAPRPAMQQSQPKPQQAAAPVSHTPSIRNIAPRPAATPRQERPQHTATPVPSIPRINVMPKADSPVANETATETAAKSNAGNAHSNFSDDQWDAAWRQYIADNPKEKLLASIMNTYKAVRIGSSASFRIMVDNIGMVEVLNSHSPELLKYLRSHLRNNDITLKISVNENAPRTVIKQPQEIVADMMARNHNFKSFVERFKLGLA